MTDISESKPKTLQSTSDGVAHIKSEYIVTDHVRPLAAGSVAEVDAEKLSKTEDENRANESEGKDEAQKHQRLSKAEKKKLRGQNKARRPPIKFDRKECLCPYFVDVKEGEDLPTCQSKRCDYLHSISEFMSKRPPDIGPDCHVFNLRGHCPRGPTCRFGSCHITSEGRNKVNREVYEKLISGPPETLNIFDKDLQFNLRKRKYDFSRSEAVLKRIDNRAASKQNAVDEEKKENKGVKRDYEGVAKEEPKTSAVDTNEDIHDDGSGANKSEANDEKKSDDISERKNTFDGEERHCEGVTTLGGESNNAKTNDGESEEHLSEANNEKKTNEVSEEKKIFGSITDEDIIKIRQSEKKKIDWKGKLSMTPLTTVGNLPFRRICKEYGVDVTCGEMAMGQSLLQGLTQEWALVKKHRSEDIFGVQLCGNNPYIMSKAAQVLEDSMEVDFIDINIGCPIDLVYHQGGGCGLMRRPRVLQSIVQCMSQTLSIPLTVKTRTGITGEKNLAHTFMPGFRDWGASLITVHGRSREQRYTRSANWEYIDECARLASPIPVFGNGDIMSWEDYQHVMDTYKNVSGAMIGRGALIKPWIFTEIKEQRMWDISSRERLDILRKYVHYGLEHWGGDNKGVENTRRFLLEWLSFLHRYIPVGILERPPQKINERPPVFRGRDELETLMSSPNCAHWIKISEMLLGPVPDGFSFLPKHKANSWK